MRWIALSALACALSVHPRQEPVVVFPRAPMARPLTGEPPTCQGGCAQVMPERPRISEARIKELLDRYAKEGSADVLNELLFHGASVMNYIRKHGSTGLRRGLEDELARREVLVEFRMGDDEGRVEVNVSKVYPLGEKRRHVADEAIGIQAPRLSLILHRVAADRIWSRL